jgi:hypothetical protein
MLISGEGGVRGAGRAPPEQLSGYLSFRQDLGMLMSWIDADVPLQIPHIRDMTVVRGDFVAGPKVDIRDSIVSRTEIRTAPEPDDGKYLVHAERQAGEKVEVTNSVISRSDPAGRVNNVEVYQNRSRPPPGTAASTTASRRCSRRCRPASA